jgi:serpin B
MRHPTRHLAHGLGGVAAAILVASASGATVAQEASVTPLRSGAPMASATTSPTVVEVLDAGDRGVAPVVAPEDLASVVAGDTAFAIDLYRSVADDAENVVLGPLSISVAMAMQHAGARGDTAAQLQRAMHFELPTERLDTAFDALGRSLAATNGPGVTSTLVNQLFGQASYPFEPAFLDDLGTHYDAPLATVDFGADPDAARTVINRWIADQTAGRITDLIPPGAIHELTRLVLVNATYLDAAWAHPFNAALTTERAFRLASGRRVRVPTMSRLGDELVARGNGYRAIELAYEGDRLAMLVVVPDDLARFERDLTPRRLDRIVDRLEQEFVDLTMPTFSVASAVDLVPPLRALGITDAFDPKLAELSGISAEPGLHLDAAVHQAFITVGEAGTQAGAATALGDSGAEMNTTLRINRPFLWLIRDRETGSVLYLGRVIDPRVTGS